MKNISAETELTKQSKSKSIHFNRFLLFRYITAIFFFINLYWSILFFSALSIWIILPLLLIVIDIAIIIEQTTKYWHPSNRLFITKTGYAVQIFSNLLGIIIILIGQQQLLFPFINNEGRGLLLASLFVGCLVGIVVEWRAWQIEHNKDAYLRHMEIFENNVKKER
ncbi:hypothetical protein BCR24_03105 [Enterococcus ureilyticus]|uniref:PTS cellobiose transporter subunit IIC n=1 Tax=Enterococcus ureilyticus TaxID=1131292 RepID=A0A1E5HB29_9ENTE|nr:hypothetical protein [Enterococcus ureilyticus]MBM7690530.1 magnesium-transporting ATPase (P-type) [Enterococcus ureilyticus]OEG22134.1 hypothetical protein BCR24_03105 [Enterococcus ureilyticus]